LLKNFELPARNSHPAPTIAVAGLGSVIRVFWIDWFEKPRERRPTFSPPSDNPLATGRRLRNRKIRFPEEHRQTCVFKRHWGDLP
jgi:hypothetical protein